MADMRDAMIVLEKELRDIARDSRSLFALFVPFSILPVACFLISLQSDPVQINDGNGAPAVYIDEESFGGDDVRFHVVTDALVGLFVEVGETVNPEEALREDGLLAVVHLGSGGVTEIVYDESSQESVRAAELVAESLEEARRSNSRLELEGLGVDSEVFEVHEFRVETLSASTIPGGGSPLVIVGPMLLVMLILLEGGNIAVDVFAGEKERGTLEGLLTTQVSRVQLFVGKYLAVLAVCLVGTLGTVSGFVLSYLWFPGAMESIGLGLPAVPGNGFFRELATLCLSFAFLAASISALLSITSRSSKEAQLKLSIISSLPLILGIAAGMGSGVEGSSYVLLVIPVVNDLIALREVFASSASGVSVLVVSVVNLATAAGVTWLCGRRLDRESVLARQ